MTRMSYDEFTRRMTEALNAEREEREKREKEERERMTESLPEAEEAA